MGTSGEEKRFNSKSHVSFWVNFKNHLKKYCELSSIHGLSYIVSNVSWVEKLWWIVIVIACVTGCIVMVSQIFDKWITTPVLISLANKETPIYEIPFPAVTICPESKISTTCVNYTKILLARKHGIQVNITSLENKYFDYMAFLCTPENHDLSSDHFENETLDFSEFLTECSSVNLELALCRWMGINMRCKDIMHPILTDEGLCYTFNMFDTNDIYSDINQMRGPRKINKANWNPDWGYPKYERTNVYPRNAFTSGAHSAFIAVFFTKKDQLDFACRHFNIQGMRVSLNIPTRIPRPSQVFFSVGLDSITNAAVLPLLTSVTPNVKDYDPHDRYCYFSTERSLKFFQIYSQGNCNMECWTNYTLQYCSCVIFYMPRDNQTRLCGLQDMNCLEEARVTYPAATLREKLWFQNEAREGPNEIRLNCDCLPLCSDLVYNAEIASGHWDFNNLDEAASDLHKELINHYYASAVRIYFKNDFFLPAKKDELYDVTDVISDCGGILGLFLGFSLFSIAELIYFFSIKFIENHRRYGHWAGNNHMQENIL